MGARRRSSSSPTAGRATGANSSSTRRERAGTASTSATRSSPSWTSATGRSPTPRTAASPASRAAATGRASSRCGGLATHSGDALFELCYLPEFREAARALRDEYDGSYERFWEDFNSRPALSKQSDFPLINEWAMAACYSANEDGSIDLPFDTATGMLRDDVWQRWRARVHRRVGGQHAEALRSMRAIYIDRGKRDEFYLDLRAEAFRRELEALGITDVFFELFDAGHMGIEYRCPLAIRYLAERLQT